MEATGINPTEIFSSTLFTKNEQDALLGIPHKSLPETFSLSPRVLSSCLEVWSRFEKAKPRRKLEAWARATNYFAPKAAAGDEHAIQFMDRRKSLLGDEIEKDTEFGRQLYAVGSDIVVGKVHKGEGRGIVTRDTLDGIPDQYSVVNIHSHPSNLTFSERDILSVISDLPKVPERCLYFEIGTQTLYLLFPTIDSPRIDFDTLYESLRRDINKEFLVTTAPEAERERIQIDRIRTLAERFKLGYYGSPKEPNLQRIV